VRSKCLLCALGIGTGPCLTAYVSAGVYWSFQHPRRQMAKRGGGGGGVGGGIRDVDGLGSANAGFYWVSRISRLAHWMPLSICVCACRGKGSRLVQTET
jgi:hypothetical protein